jgi:ketosteroid isomerase-like protein
VLPRLVVIPRRVRTARAAHATRVAWTVGALVGVMGVAACRSAAPAQQHTSLGTVRLASTSTCADSGQSPASGQPHKVIGSAKGAVIGGPAQGRAFSAGESPTAAAREICAMMARSAADWNRGDLDAFMADYMPGETTTYIGRNGVLHGPEAIRWVYAPRFAPGGVRDSLSFENLEVDLLAPNVAHAIAYYVLSRGDSTVARGPTSLVMGRVEGRWRIVHDHSS